VEAAEAMENPDAAKAAAERPADFFSMQMAAFQESLEESLAGLQVQELRRELRSTPSTPRAPVEAEAAEAAEAAWAALEEPETELARLFTEMNRQHQGGTFAESSAPLRSRPELQRLRLQMERAWPDTSLADAFVNFAGKGSDTLYVGIFARVANDLGLTTEESTAIFRILSGNKSFVQLEDWDGLLLGALQIAPQVSNVAQQPPAPPNMPEDLGDMGDLSDSEEETSTESTFPGSDSEGEGSGDEPSSPEEDDHSLTQPNDLKALVQVLQAQLKLSEEETNRWQREAHRQEEAATELREKMRLTQVWGTIGSVQELIKSAGIGFIRPYSGPVNGKDLFFHKSELKKGNFHTLAIGDEVSYEVMLNPAKKRTFAANVMLTKRYS